MNWFAAGPVLLLPFALALDVLLGDPDWLWRRVPHPVVLFGRLIGWLDRKLNDGGESARRLTGIVSLALLMGAAGLAAITVHFLCTQIPFGVAVEVLAVAALLAQRSLYDHVRHVYAAFGEGGLAAAREAVSHVVGRNPDALDESGVCRAAIETTAENFSDGVVAPAFWYLVAGLPGIAIYKAVNTADSMIGHRLERYRAFGWASARLDDGLNFIPARLSGVLTVLAAPLVGTSMRDAWRIMLRDAHLHRSPNAGWPEAAMAGALGIAIAGPRVYATGPVYDPYVNGEARKDLHPRDIKEALQLFLAACAVQWALCVALAISVLWR